MLTAGVSLGDVAEKITTRKARGVFVGSGSLRQPPTVARTKLVQCAVRSNVHEECAAQIRSTVAREFRLSLTPGYLMLRYDASSCFERRTHSARNATIGSTLI